MPIDEARADAGRTRPRRPGAAHRSARRRVVADRRHRPARRGRAARDDPALLHLGDGPFPRAAAAYLDLAPALRERVPDIDYVDLRFDERVYVRPTDDAQDARPEPDAGRERASKTAAMRRLACGTGDAVARKERYLVGLDVGTSKVSAIVGEIDRRRRPRHHRHRPRRLARHPARRRRQSRGGRRIDQESDRRGRADGRRRDRFASTSALSGAHVKAFNSRGVVAVAGKNREITREDVRRAIDAAQGGGAAERPGNPARPAAGLRRRRAGRHRRAGRNDRHAGSK